MINIVLLSDIDMESQNLNSTDIRTLCLARMLHNNYIVFVHSPKGIAQIIISDNIKFKPISPKIVGDLTRELIVIVALTRWAISTAEDKYNLAKQRIVDLYCPRILENTFVEHQGVLKKLEKSLSEKFEIYLIKRALNLGTSFIVANTRQRDWVFGLMTIHGSFFDNLYLRNNPNNYVKIVPLIFSQDMQVKKSDAKAYLTNICQVDLKEKFVIIWSGGWHEWLDIESVIQASTYICNKYKDVCVVLGAQSSKNTKLSKQKQRTLERVTRQLQDTPEIIMLKYWIPFGEHINLIKAADVSIVLSHDHIEDHFSHRTRAVESIDNQVAVIINKNNILAENGSSTIYPVESGNITAIIHTIEQIRSQWLEQGRVQHTDNESHNDTQGFQNASKNLEDLIKSRDVLINAGHWQTARSFGRMIDVARRVTRAANRVIIKYSKFSKIV